MLSNNEKYIFTSEIGIGYFKWFASGRWFENACWFDADVSICAKN